MAIVNDSHLDCSQRERQDGNKHAWTFLDFFKASQACPEQATGYRERRSRQSLRVEIQ
jgi:hypothetical protein